MVILIVFTLFIFQFLVFLSYPVNALLISCLIIEMCALLLGLKNERRNIESRFEVGPDLGWIPTTYKILSYYTSLIPKKKHTHTQILISGDIRYDKYQILNQDLVTTFKYKIEYTTCRQKASIDNVELTYIMIRQFPWITIRFNWKFPERYLIWGHMSLNQSCTMITWSSFQSVHDPVIHGV